MIRRITVATLAATLLIPVAQAATNQVPVWYGDLDLASSAGRAALTDRVQAAARLLCKPVLERAPDSEPSIREHQSQYRACVGRLTQRALVKVRITHS